MGALDTAVGQGKALYAGISSYSAEKTREAYAILSDLLQRRSSSTSPRTRCSTAGSSPTSWTRSASSASAAFHVLAACAGDAHRPLPRRDPGGRAGAAAPASSLWPDLITEGSLDKKIRALNDLAAGRGQTLAQMALAGRSANERVTSTLVGASSVEQLDDNVRAVERLELLRRRAGRDL